MFPQAAVADTVDSISLHGRALQLVVKVIGNIAVEGGEGGLDEYPRFACTGYGVDEAITLAV